jgi:cell division protein FtsZ
MTINLKIPDIREMKPRITVFGIGGAGGNAVNNMITAGLEGVDFVVANTDAQALTTSKAERIIQMGAQVTEGLGAGSQPEVGRAAAEEVIDEIRDHLTGAHMVFVTAGMGGGTGTGAAPIIAQAAREMGILTVGVVTKPFQFEGQRRMRFAETGISELTKVVDTLLIIPNQNLFRVANEKTTFADAFAMADQVLYSGVACITDLMVKEGLINLDFADVRAVMREMGKAMMGTGEASGEKRALTAAEAAIANPLIDDASMKGAKGLLISITGGKDLTLYEVDADANIIVGATFDESLEGIIRVSVVATGIDHAMIQQQKPSPAENVLKELAGKLRNDSRRIADRVERERPPQLAPLATPTSAPAAAAPAQTAPANTAATASHETAAHAAVAAAILPSSGPENVSLRPMPMKPSLFEPAQPESAPADPPMPAAYIPPAPERVTPRVPRMPRVDELPLPAQNEIRAQRGELAEDHPEKRRVSLMQRLASVGLGRRAEEMEPPPAPRTAKAIPQVERPPRPTARQPEGRPPPVSEYARRPATQGLDPHGRPAPVHNGPEDDQLDIPAFLRRQAN